MTCQTDLPPLASNSKVQHHSNKALRSGRCYCRTWNLNITDSANTREVGNTNKKAIQLYSTQNLGEWNKKLPFKGLWESPTHNQNAAYPDSLAITRTTSTGRPHRTSVMTIVIKTYHICIRAFVVMYNPSCQAVPLAAAWDVSAMSVFNYISLRIWTNNKEQLFF